MEIIFITGSWCYAKSAQKAPAMTMWSATSHAHMDMHGMADSCDCNLHIENCSKHFG